MLCRRGSSSQLSPICGSDGARRTSAWSIPIPSVGITIPALATLSLPCAPTPSASQRRLTRRRLRHLSCWRRVTRVRGQAPSSDVEDDSDYNPCHAPAWNRQWGRQSMIVDGMIAGAQLRGHLGDAGLAEWVYALTGVHSSTEDAVHTAIEVLVKALRGTTEVCAASFAVPAATPTVCAACGLPTCAVGFLGQGICALCFAAGGRGASLAMVAGVLSDKGELYFSCFRYNAVCTVVP